MQAISAPMINTNAAHSEPVLRADVVVDLPLEIVLLILEILALHFPKKAVELVRISKSVQSCIDPILYEFVCLNDQEAIALFSRTLTIPCVNKSLSFFRDHVKAICFQNGLDAIEDAHIIVNACSNIHSLAFYGSPRKLEPYKSLSLRRFSSQYFAEVLHPTNPIFPALTHLDLDLFTAPWGKIQIPECLPLTHLSIENASGYTPSNLASLSAIFPDQLRVCILKVKLFHLLFDSNDSCCKGCCDHDVRIVFAVPPPSPRERQELSDALLDHLIFRRADSLSFSMDWGRLPAGEKDIWELAEDAIERRREKLRIASQQQE